MATEPDIERIVCAFARTIVARDDLGGMQALARYCRMEKGMSKGGLVVQEQIYYFPITAEGIPPPNLGSRWKK